MKLYYWVVSATDWVILRCNRSEFNEDNCPRYPSDGGCDGGGCRSHGGTGLLQLSARYVQSAPARE